MDQSAAVVQCRRAMRWSRYGQHCVRHMLDKAGLSPNACQSMGEEQTAM